MNQLQINEREYKIKIAEQENETTHFKEQLMVVGEIAVCYISEIVNLTNVSQLFSLESLLDPIIKQKFNLIKDLSNELNVMKKKG